MVWKSLEDFHTGVVRQKRKGRRDFFVVEVIFISVNFLKSRWASCSLSNETNFASEDLHNRRNPTVHLFFFSFDVWRRLTSFGGICVNRLFNVSMSRKCRTCVRQNLLIKENRWHSMVNNVDQWHPTDNLLPMKFYWLMKQQKELCPSTKRYSTRICFNSSSVRFTWAASRTFSRFVPFGVKKQNFARSFDDLGEKENSTNVNKKKQKGIFT